MRMKNRKTSSGFSDRTYDHLGAPNPSVGSENSNRSRGVSQRQTQGQDDSDRSWMSGLMDSWMWSDWFREATGTDSPPVEREEVPAAAKTMDWFSELGGTGFPHAERKEVPAAAETVDTFHHLDISRAEIQAAQSWGETETLDRSAIRALQSKLGILATGK